MFYDALVDINLAVPLLMALHPGERRVMYKLARGIEVTATRTDRISENDFAVGLNIIGRPEFYPTHVRLLIDLHLKSTSNEEGALKLLAALESVYKGEDPFPLAEKVGNLTFPMQLDGPDVNLFYAQLLMIEQDFNYGPGKKSSSFDPPRGFLMAFIRWVMSKENQIDKVITAAVRNYPPPKRFDTPKSGLFEL